MDKQIIIDKLLRLPEEIKSAELAVIDAQVVVTKAKEALMRKENQLILDRLIDGKNAEIRGAQLKEFTKVEREAVNIAENKLALARMELNQLLNQFKAYRAIAELLESEVA